MRSLTSIVAVNEDGVIGAGNRLPWKVRTDLRFFRDQTQNNLIIMGRKTHDSLGGCLPRRTNIVVTHGFGLSNGGPNCQYAMGIEESLVLAERLLKARQQAFVVGGATMYEQFSPYVDRYLITEISKSVPDGDTFFSPDTIGDVSDWNMKIISSGNVDVAVGDEASFKIFELTSKNPEAFAQRRREAVERHQSKSHFLRREAFVKQSTLATA